MEDDIIYIIDDQELELGKDYLYALEVEGDNAILITQWLNNFRYGDRVNIMPRSTAPSEVLMHYKKGIHQRTGVMQRVFKDIFGMNWFEILHTIDDEPVVIIYNLRYWTFD